MNPPVHPMPHKRGFHFPVPAESWQIFAHPFPEHDFHRPGLIGTRLCVCNGWLLIRADRFALGDIAEASPAFVQRWEKIVWPQDSPAWNPETRNFRGLEEAVPQLFRYGPRPLWEKGMLKWHPRVRPAVRVGLSAILPQNMLQAVSMLPRVEIATTNSQGQPVPFRFNGGEGLLHNFQDGTPGQVDPAFSIFTPPLR